jgi:hypothetical protein
MLSNIKLERHRLDVFDLKNGKELTMTFAIEVFGKKPKPKTSQIVEYILGHDQYEIINHETIPTVVNIQVDKSIFSLN